MRAATSMTLAAAAALNALDAIVCWLGARSRYEQVWAAASEKDRLDQMQQVYSGMFWGGFVLLTALAIAVAAIVHSRHHVAALVLVALAAGATVGARAWLRLSDPRLSIAVAVVVLAGLGLLVVSGRGYRSAAILRHHLGAGALLAAALWSLVVWVVFAFMTWDAWWLAKLAGVMALVSLTLLVALVFTFAGWRIPRLISLTTGWIVYAVTMSMAVPLIGISVIQVMNYNHNSPTHLGGVFFTAALIPLVLLAPLGFSLLAQRAPIRSWSR